MNVKEIIICFDGDETGKAAAQKVSHLLKEKNITTYIINLPEKDANEYFKTKAAKDFMELEIHPVASGATPQEGNLKLSSLLKNIKIKESAETAYNRTETGFIVTFDARRYEIKGIARQNTQLKATIKAVNSPNPSWDKRGGHAVNSPNPSWDKRGTPAQKNAPFELSTIDLYSNRSREYYAKICSALFGEKEEITKQDLNRIIERIEDHTKEPEKKESKEIPEADKKEAMKFLKNPDLFTELLKDFETLGCVGEETNKLITYLACTSRLLDKPLSVVIQSRSGAGKSNLQDAVLSLMPEQACVKYTRLTDQALYYLDKDALVHKILAIEEIEGVGGAAYSLRSIQSNGNIVVAYTTKDPATGKMKTEEKQVNGPTPLLSTTTNPDIDPELLSRCIILSIDETKEMTLKILEQQREEDTLEGYKRTQAAKKIKSKHHAVQKLLIPVTVINPYKKDIRYNADSLKARRDHKKYLTIIKTITLLNQHQRERKKMTIENEETEYIEVAIKDIAHANKIANIVLGISLDDLCPQARRLLGLIREMVEKGETQEIEQGVYIFNRRALREHTKWSDWQIKTYLKQLEEMEFIYARQGSKGKEYHYELHYHGQTEGRFYLDLVDTEELKKKYPGRE